MSFFKDFKDDLSQAVNELVPEEEKKAVDDTIDFLERLFGFKFKNREDYY